MGTTAASEALQTFQEVRLEAPSPTSSEEHSLAMAGDERGERLTQEIAMLSSPMASAATEGRHAAIDQRNVHIPTLYKVGFASILCYTACDSRTVDASEQEMHLQPFAAAGKQVAATANLAQRQTTLTQKLEQALGEYIG